MPARTNDYYANPSHFDEDEVDEAAVEVEAGPTRAVKYSRDAFKLTAAFLHLVEAALPGADGKPQNRSSDDMKASREWLHALAQALVQQHGSRSLSAVQTLNVPRLHAVAVDLVDRIETLLLGDASANVVQRRMTSMAAGKARRSVRRGPVLPPAKAKQAGVFLEDTLWQAAQSPPEPGDHSGLTIAELLHYPEARNLVRALGMQLETIELRSSQPADDEDHEAELLDDDWDFFEEEADQPVLDDEFDDGFDEDARDGSFVPRREVEIDLREDFVSLEDELRGPVIYAGQEHSGYRR